MNLRIPPKMQFVLFPLVLLILFLGSLEILIKDLHLTVKEHKNDPLIRYFHDQNAYRIETASNGQKIVKTQDFSFHFEEFPLEKGPSVIRIFCLGGSSVNGFGIDHQVVFPYPKQLAFCHLLGQQLAARYPDLHFEMINSGRDSYDSIRILGLTRELLGYRPDLFVIYAGHNDYLSAENLDTIQALLRQRTGLQSLQKILRKSHLYMGLRALITQMKERGRDRQRQDYLLEKQRLFTRVVEFYEHNVNQILTLARASDTEVVLSTVASNVRDEQPIESIFASHLAYRQQIEFMTYFRNACYGFSWGFFDSVVKNYQDALRIDNTYALAHYDLARAYEKQQAWDFAYREYYLAKDLDASPVRAREDINTTIKKLAAEFHVPLANSQAALEAASPHRLPGANLFSDYVHPNRQAHQIIAETIFRQIEAEKLILKIVAKRGR